MQASQQQASGIQPLDAPSQLLQALNCKDNLQPPACTRGTKAFVPAGGTLLAVFAPAQSDLCMGKCAWRHNCMNHCKSARGASIERLRSHSHLVGWGGRLTSIDMAGRGFAALSPVLAEWGWYGVAHEHAQWRL
eukprot:365748-Chlamydomonas_euryale.AAC.3